MQSHRPVLLDEVLDVFKAAQGPVRTFFDGTFGRGGHTRAVLDSFPGVQVTAFDWDDEAIRHGHETFREEEAAGRIRFYHNSFHNFAEVRTRCANEGFPQAFDLMLLDLGVSSPQLDEAERGFSFYHEGPLDMRMDRRRGITAADIINGWTEKDLNDLFHELGEVHSPFRVVRAIIHDRKQEPFSTTRQLSSLIERVEGWRKKGFHPATQYFMGLRLQVNSELNGLDESLPSLIEGLDDRGRLAVITFHSLEDRIVKRVFKDHLEQGGLVNKRVITPTDAELKANSRSRSAKLRAFEKGAPKKKKKYERDQG